MILMVVEASIFIFMMLLTIFNCPAQGTDLAQDLARWHSSLRAYMPAHETISASPGFDKIDRYGPNALRMLIGCLEHASSFDESRALIEAVRLIGGMRPTILTDQAWDHDAAINAYGDEFLTTNSHRASLSEMERVRLKRRMILEFWKNKRLDGITLRDLKLAHDMRKIALRKKTADEILEHIRAPHAARIIDGGIYSLPCLIDLLKEENDPIIFALFLNCSRQVADYRVFYENSGERWSALTEKQKYVSHWWAKNKEKYKLIHDLYPATDKSVGALSKT